jgi:hypothetical protein
MSLGRAITVLLRMPELRLWLRRERWGSDVGKFDMYIPLLLHAENQPNQPALWAGLEEALQRFFQSPAVFLTLHSLLPANALWDALRNKASLFAFAIR